MEFSLRSKLSLTYVFVAMVCVMLISVFANVFLDKHFSDYIIKNQERRNYEVVSLIEQQFQNNGTWNAETVESIGINALEQGMIIKVEEADGSLVWSAVLHNNGLCQQMISHMAENMLSRYPNWKGEYVENKYSLKSDFGVIGQVEIGYYGPYFFNDSDLAFINTINSLLLAVAVFSLILSLIIGAVMAKRISKPISSVIGTARMISRGYFGNRSRIRSNTKEINQLTETINNLAETLENQETLRKRLTADVAHELRTPLATLQSHMEAMLDGIWKPDADRLKSCHEEIMRMGRLVGDIEKLARYEAENTVLNITRFDITETARHIINNFEHDFAEKGIKITLDGGSVFVEADRDKISQVLVNLLSNSLKYTSHNGMVEVSIAKGAQEEAVINVRDTGSGISPEDLPHIFERFYRADRSRNRLTGGAGIGLAITKAIIEAHNGTISVSSEVDRGTDFKITLPETSGQGGAEGNKSFCVPT